MTKIIIIKGDITEQDTDAIVNSANPRLSPGGGISGLIHQKAGKNLNIELKKTLKEIPLGFLETGSAILSKGWNLPTKYIIHTVGPKITINQNNWVELLRKSYQSCIDIAIRNGITSISFPSISTGIYGCPIKDASVIAIKTVKNRLTQKSNNIKEVRFILFSENDYQIYKNLIS